jgi:hypothetical protein
MKWLGLFVRGLGKGNGKAFPLQALGVPGGSDSRISRQHRKVVRLSALCTSHLYPQMWLGTIKKPIRYDILIYQRTSIFSCHLVPEVIDIACFAVLSFLLHNCSRSH